MIYRLANEREVGKARSIVDQRGVLSDVWIVLFGSCHLSECKL